MNRNLTDNPQEAIRRALSHPAFANPDTVTEPGFASGQPLSPWVQRNLDHSQFARARGSMYAGPERVK
jgi:hypothetical protein